MGVFSSRKPTSQQQINNYVEESFQGVEEQPQEKQKKVIRNIPKCTKPNSELTFKPISNAKRQAIKKSPIVESLITSEEWIVAPDVIEHLRIINALQVVEVSAARAMHVTMMRSSNRLICVGEKELGDARYSEDSSEEKQLGKEYAVIYADLFRIRFENLVKLKLKGQSSKDHPEAILSLEPVCKIYTPYLEEFIADGHPITNVRFLRKCQWPFLSRLSLKGNAIADSHEFGLIISNLTNSCHLQALDIAGLYTHQWGEISWLIKLGFADAEEERNLLESSEQYYDRYQGHTLVRVDCSSSKNKGVWNHKKMVTRKFNNTYFENPMTIW